MCGMLDLNTLMSIITAINQHNPTTKYVINNTDVCNLKFLCKILLKIRYENMCPLKIHKFIYSYII